MYFSQFDQVFLVSHVCMSFYRGFLGKIFNQRILVAQKNLLLESLCVGSTLFTVTCIELSEQYTVYCAVL